MTAHAPSPHCSAGVDATRLAHLRKACPPGDGPTSFGAVVGLFLELSVQRLGDMRRALAAGDAPSLQRLAHAVKGSGALFGAMRLSDLGAELEEAAGRTALEEAKLLVGRLEAEMAVVEAVLASQP